MYFKLDGEPFLHSDGHAGINYIYDENGNRVDYGIWGGSSPLNMPMGIRLGGPASITKASKLKNNILV